MTPNTETSHPEPLQNVGVSMARGAAWMTLYKLAERSITFVSTLILARLLTPADFGLVAMATSVVALMELMGAFGFDVAIIQRQDVQRAHYDTAWTFNVLFSVAAVVLLLLLTVPAADFFREPRLHWILPILGISALVQGFENIGTVAFRKDLNFRREFHFLLSKKIAPFVVTIGLALAFRSYWALVGGIVMGKLFAVWFSYHLHPYRPQFTLAARKDLFQFSKWLFISNLVLFLQHKSANFILGRTVGAYGLGIYLVAHEVAMLPASEMIAPLNRAIFPAYSRMSGDLPQLGRRFLEVFGVIALIAFPVAIGLACVAAPAVLVVLGNQWVEAIPLLRLLTVAGLVSALQGNLYLVIVAMGKPKVNTLVSASTLILSLPVFIVASIHYGTVGAAWTYLIFSVVGLGTINFVFFRLTDIKIRDYWSTFWRPLFSSAAMAGVVLITSEYFDRAIGDQNDILKLASLVLVGALVYATTVVLLWLFAGKPQGAEKTILDFSVARLLRFRQGNSKL